MQHLHKPGVARGKCPGMRYKQPMASRHAPSPQRADNDADAVTDAVLTASRLLVAVSARSIASVDESITLPQFRMLVVLSTQGPLKLSILANHLGVNPSTATRMIDRLTASDLVSRQVNPTSRREIVLELTTTGAAAVNKVTQRRRHEIAQIVARMPAKHRHELIEALEAFSEAGGEPPAHDHYDTRTIDSI
jgi:DNA-binding MarR family transcriptional regulator